MRAQTAIVAALAHRPELLILDEPSNGLDAVVRLDIIDAVIRTVADEGRCVLFSSHLLDEMERTCDHVTMIQNGKITFDCDLDAMKASHQITQVTFTVASGRAAALAARCRSAASLARGARSGDRDLPDIGAPSRVATWRNLAWRRSRKSSWLVPAAPCVTRSR